MPVRSIFNKGNRSALLLIVAVVLAGPSDVGKNVSWTVLVADGAKVSDDGKTEKTPNPVVIDCTTRLALPTFSMSSDKTDAVRVSPKSKAVEETTMSGTLLAARIDKSSLPNP
jgi:hypothetical protein